MCIVLYIHLLPKHAPYNLNSALYARLCVYNIMIIWTDRTYQMHTINAGASVHMIIRRWQTFPTERHLLVIASLSYEFHKQVSSFSEVVISSRKLFPCEEMVLDNFSPCFLWIEEISPFQEVDLWTFVDKRCYIDAWFGLLWWWRLVKNSRNDAWMDNCVLANS